MIFFIFRDCIIPTLQTFLTWPVLSFITILIFRDNIKNFIDKIIEINWDKKTIKTGKQERNEDVEKNDDLKGAAKDEWDYKRLYLDLFLQPNTIEALRWLNSNGGEYTTTEFMEKFVLPELTYRSPEDEKVIILTALEQNGLAQLRSNKYSISEEGKNYLKDRKFIG
ncbi:MAG TPA: hypothetical protein VIJ29_00355 [Candidatus Paceibacterota bacterium]